MSLNFSPVRYSRNDIGWSRIRLEIKMKCVSDKLWPPTSRGGGRLIRGGRPPPYVGGHKYSGVFQTRSEFSECIDFAFSLSISRVCKIPGWQVDGAQHHPC